VIRADPDRTYARVDESIRLRNALMTIPAKIDHNTSRALTVIAVRAVDDAHLTWVAVEVESEHALRAWFDADVPQGAGAYLAYRAAVDREEAAARDLQRLSELTQPCQERLARTQ
jgi:hypothetical protein